MKCRGCGEEIHFVKSHKGKMIPVNGDEPETFCLQENVPGEPQIVVVLENGYTIRGRSVPSRESGTVVRGWISHFATCPRAEDFRKAR